MPAELLLLLIVAFASPSCQVLSSLRMAAILDDQTVCGRGERLALALAREQINGIIEVPAKARVEVDIFELQRDSQYETTDTIAMARRMEFCDSPRPASGASQSWEPWTEG
ncbi:GRIK5 isoform 6 [Pan troglodytes]|uniref:Glutamate ionotropic receptor kainate type subunit 5 n=3 Tax=Homininae TaxID=207598 RepID=M0QXF6_HUMAN|nr:glutamate ionotropic receptor kainate type subunit 5 [Homo sapiens]KAI4042962.1 glutamate ionotropic receptor kainate type subunit 5 [Homo sapiens]PNI95399.1 GRIK5 isoform 6 [Pan troglodytes]